MRILTVNTGSSSVRLAVFIKDDSGLRMQAKGHFETARAEPAEVLRSFIDAHKAGELSVAAHRVVHGGTSLVDPCIIDNDVEAGIDRLSPLAPLHNPVALKWIRLCRDIFGGALRQIAVFDTAFYSRLPDTAATYALPAGLCAEHGVRRYGFHGLAHSAMLRQWRRIMPGLEGGGRVISIQLGAGCSITAVRNGRAVDTSMGFTPLEGLVMATRSGDVDPGLIAYLIKATGRSADDIEMMLNNSSGLLGVSGYSADMRALLKSGEPGARLAVDLYCYRARKYIGAYMAVLGGADAVLFGGGVGENSPEVRQRILSDMQWCGIAIDPQRNTDVTGREGDIGTSDSSVRVRVIPVDEASVLAEEAAVFDVK